MSVSTKPPYLAVVSSPSNNKPKLYFNVQSVHRVLVLLYIIEIELQDHT